MDNGERHILALYTLYVLSVTLNNKILQDCLQNERVVYVYKKESVVHSCHLAAVV